MNKKLAIILLSIFLQVGYAQSDPVALSVWVNEAIVATYTYSYKSYLEEQKKIAKYFTANGWMAYTEALNASKLPEAVQNNLYYVSAVAIDPPVITDIGANHWKASMGLLVLYQNPQYKQRQTLKVTIDFTAAPSGQGVRGYSINTLQAVLIKAPCKCAVEEEEEEEDVKKAAPPTKPRGAKS
jgi:hypothetical protein